MPIAGKSSAHVVSDSSLGRRIASAAVLAPAAIAAAWVGGALFAAAVAFAAIIMVFEWARIIDGRDFTPVFYGLAIAGAAALGLAAAGYFLTAWVVCAVGGLAAAILARWGARRSGWAAFGAFYILAPSAALIWLRSEVDNGRELTLMLFAIVWAADSGGYFAGRLVGGPRMSPVVSPAKTWAGAAGGLLLGGLAGLIAALLIYGDGPIGFYALAGAMLGLSSILGDMAESAIKRLFGVKDASQLIPGHGGALDRLDGMIFATTAMTLALFLNMLFRELQG